MNNNADKFNRKYWINRLNGTIIYTSKVFQNPPVRNPSVMYIPVDEWGILRNGWSSITIPPDEFLSIYVEIPLKDVHRLHQDVPANQYRRMLFLLEHRINILKKRF